jgi:hypothetical protein
VKSFSSTGDEEVLDGFLQVRSTAGVGDGRRTAGRRAGHGEEGGEAEEEEEVKDVVKGRHFRRSFFVLAAATAALFRVTFQLLLLLQSSSHAVTGIVTQSSHTVKSQSQRVLART